ncbi:hypothetical protein [Pararhizobium sp.]|uniref:hypothetical protein n=1 Tax=Pararhizobium sp. TaxID=1977563 RepID=UPI003BAC4219
MARLDGSLTMILADHPAEHGKNALTNSIISASSRSIGHFGMSGLFAGGTPDEKPATQVTTLGNYILLNTR